VLILGLMHDRASVLYAAMADLKPGDWTLAEHLAAIQVDLLAGGNWQRAGKRGAPKPKPISPLAQRGRTQHTGGTSLPQEQVLALLAARGPARRDESTEVGGDGD
jgi:hypothetical protein